MLAACYFVFPSVFPSLSVAQTITPFETSNQNPVIQVHGLPSVESGQVLLKGKNRFRLSSNIASNYTAKKKSNEEVLFDGETTRLTFSFFQGIGNNFEWGLRIPYIYHEGGTLDAFIVSWHDLFGLPQNNRDKTPKNKLVYRYSRNGNTLFNVTSPEEGAGDIQLNGAWQWRKAGLPDNTHLAVRASASLPTGDADSLLGSGGMDMALWLSADRNGLWFNRSGSLWGGAGILFLGDGEVLEKQQRDTVWFGSFGGGLKMTPRLSLKLQFDIHTAFYNNSQLTPISEDALQVIMGGDIRLSKNTLLDLAVKEDPTISASPDVVFHVGVTINN